MDTKLVKDVWKWTNGAALAEKLAATLDQRVNFALCRIHKFVPHLQLLLHQLC